MTATAKRRSLSFGALMGGVAVLAVLSVAVTLFAYFRLLHYERAVARHLPDDSTAAVLFNVEQGPVYEPIREHFIPLIDAIPPSDSTRVGRIEERTGLKRRDLREILVSTGPTPSDWVIVLGGLFPTEHVISGLVEAFKHDGAKWKRSRDGSALVHVEKGVVVGQAPDGVIVVASSLGRFDRARHAKLESPALSSGSAAAFVIRSAVVSRWASQLPDDIVAELRARPSVEDIRGVVHFGEPMNVEISLRPKRGRTLEELNTLVERTLSSARAWLHRQSAAERAGERAIIDRTTQTATSDAVVVSFAWERHEIDAAAALAAEAILATLNTRF